MPMPAMVPVAMPGVPPGADNNNYFDLSQGGDGGGDGANAGSGAF